MSLRVYVLDDDAVSAEICSEILRSLNCAVEIHENRGSLVRSLRQQTPDAVFFDLVTEGGDSQFLSSLIRQDLHMPSVKLVVMEEARPAGEKVSAHNVVADAYLEKPFGIDQVHSLLQQLAASRAEVRFWGVRGSIASPGQGHDRYGGNTSCVTLKLALDEYIIMDAGTGIREFGNYLVQLGLPVRLHLLISHAHWDHIQGLPFFRPGYLPRNDLALYGSDQKNIPFERVLADQMQNTYFPVPMDTMKAHLHFHPMREGVYDVSEAEVRTFYLHHPGQTLGFRIQVRGKTMIYLCDNELTDDHSEYRERLQEFIKNADLLIADAQYIPSDFPGKRGWGHSLYTDVLDLALDAEVNRLVITHHDPDRTDEALDEIVADCRSRIAARGSSMEFSAAAEGTAIYL